MPETKCYCVLSLRQLLEAVTEAQRPDTHGGKGVELYNCVVLEGVAVEAAAIRPSGEGLHFDVRRIRRV